MVLLTEIYAEKRENMTQVTEVKQEIVVYQAIKTFVVDLTQKYSDEQTLVQKLDEEFKQFDGICGEEIIKVYSKASDILVDVLGFDETFKCSTLIPFAESKDGNSVTVGEFPRMFIGENDEVSSLIFDDGVPVYIVKRG